MVLDHCPSVQRRLQSYTKDIFSTCTMLFQNVLSCLMIPVSIASVIGNMLIIGAISTSSHLRERTGSYIVASLAVIDGFFVPISMVYFFLRYLSLIQSEGCAFFATYFAVFVYISVFHLFLLSLDRFTSIVYPFRYETILTKFRVIYLLTSGWFLPVFSVVVVPLFIHGYGESKTFRIGFLGCEIGNVTNYTPSSAQKVHLTTNIVLMIICPFIAILVFNIKIAIIAYKQTKKNIPVVQLTEEEKKNRQKYIKEMKWAKTIGK